MLQRTTSQFNFRLLLRQSEVAALRADLLALRQFRLSSQALSTADYVCISSVSDMYMFMAKSTHQNADFMLLMMQIEVTALRADLLALRQFHLKSRALSTAGSDFSNWPSEDEEEEQDLSEGLSGNHSSYRPSRRSR